MSRRRSRSGKPRRHRRPDAGRDRMPYHARPFLKGSRTRPGFFRERSRKSLIGEVAERSKALDWNSSNISTGVRGFESHPLRHLTVRSGVTMVARIGFSATTSRESRQGRKAAAAAAMSGAGA